MISFDKIFVCPLCNSDSFNHTNDTLVCSDCSSSFAVVDNIPRFVPSDNYSESFGFQWNIHQKTQLDSYTSTNISLDRLKSAAGWHSLPDLRDEIILEAGSGSGRFTEILSKTNANLITFDYSSAVDANYRNNSHQKNIVFFQGSIFEMPFKTGIFDRVFCLGVIQHTHDPKLAFFRLVDMVKSGGYIYVDIYTKSLIHLLHWKYLLRPITKKITQKKLYNFISLVVPKLIPLSIFFTNFLGRFGSRLVPIKQFHSLGLNPEINREWAILDTFDMYSPSYDNPASLNGVNQWLTELNCLEEIWVRYGDNGIVISARKK